MSRSRHINPIYCINPAVTQNVIQVQQPAWPQHGRESNPIQSEIDYVIEEATQECDSSYTENNTGLGCLGP